MVTVAEMSPARSSFEAKRRALEERRTALADARAEVARLEQAEKAALGDALDAKPGERAYKRGEKPFELRAKRERVASSIPGLEDEVAELDRLVEAAVEGAAREVVEARIAAIADLGAAHRAAWEEWAKRFAGLFDAWLGVVDTAERVDAHVGDTLAEELVTLAPQMQREVKRAGRLPVHPFPAGFTVALEMTTGVALSIDVRHNPHFAALAELVPDLRSLTRSPKLSGRVDRYDTAKPKRFSSDGREL